MKKFFLSTIIISMITIGSISFAITIGFQPPAKYMENLKTCTKSTFTNNTTTHTQEYTIKGKLPNGRCEVNIITYSDFTKNEIYKQYTTVAKNFGMPAEKIPSQQELIAKTEKYKVQTICKLSDNERKALYDAYQKHDSRLGQTSSYENLMNKFDNGPCFDIQGNDTKPQNRTTYVCEYADTTCYWNDLGQGMSTISCTKEPSSGILPFMKTVEGHAKAGMCQKI